MPKSLNDITEEEKQLIEELASYFFTPAEILVMIELDIEVDLAMSYLEFARAFQKGRLQSEIDLRKSIIKLAKSGSSPAQTMSLELLQKSKIKMLDT